MTRRLGQDKYAEQERDKREAEARAQELAAAHVAACKQARAQELRRQRKAQEQQEVERLVARELLVWPMSAGCRQLACAYRAGDQHLDPASLPRSPVPGRALLRVLLARSHLRARTAREGGARCHAFHPPAARVWGAAVASLDARPGACLGLLGPPGTPGSHLPAPVAIQAAV